VAGEWQVLDRWRLRAAYTYMRASLHIVDGGADLITERLMEGGVPQQQVSLRSIAELGRHVEFDWGVRFVDQLHNPLSPDIPAYFTLDARIAWRPIEQLEISLVGLNLLDDRHPEFGSQIITTPTREVERSFYGKITWRF
jgi:iron complex outermembrane receptor protein